MSYLVSLYNP